MEKDSVPFSNFARDDDPTQPVPGGALHANSAAGNIYSTGTANATMNSAMIGNTGGSQALNIRSPFLGIYMCIALTGIYPSRN